MKKIKFSVNENIFPLEAVLSACYGFIDNYYVSLDKKGKSFLIFLEPKNEESLEAKEIEGKFRNELLHSALRMKISNNNAEIREYIVSQALYSSLPVSENESWGNQKLDDPLGIAIPWEEKFGENITKDSVKTGKKIKKRKK